MREMSSLFEGTTYQNNNKPPIQYYTARSFGRCIYLPCRMGWVASSSREEDVGETLRTAEEMGESSLEPQQEFTDDGVLTVEYLMEYSKRQRERMRPPDIQEPTISSDATRPDEGHRIINSEVMAEPFEELDLTITIELGFLVAFKRRFNFRKESHVWWLMTERLCDARFDANPITHDMPCDVPTESGPPVPPVAAEGSIKIERDMHPDIKPPYKSWITTGLEVMTPILDLDRKERWLSPIKVILRTLKSESPDGRLGRVWTSSSSRLNVHIDRADQKPFPLSTLQNLVALWGLYDAALTPLKAHEGGSPAQWVDESNATHPGPEGNENWIRAVYGSEDKSELFALMGEAGVRPIDLTSPATRQFHQPGHGEETIEFRGHRCTLSLEDVKYWTLLTTGMLRWAHALAGANMTVNASGQLGLNDLFGLIDFPEEGRQYFLRKTILIDKGGIWVP